MVFVVLLIAMILVAVLFSIYRFSVRLQEDEILNISRGSFTERTIFPDVSEIIKQQYEQNREKDKKREKKREYQKKYRARKKLKKKVHELMMQVQEQNRAHNNEFERYDILDFDE